MRPIQFRAGLAVAAAKSTPRAAFSSHMGAAQPVMRPIWPQRPEVPMPELMAAPFIWSLNRQVASGPFTMEATTGGSQRMGFLTRLGTWSMEVPRP